MWHDSLNSDIINIKNTNDRFTGIKLCSHQKPILVISAYLPTSGKDEEFLDCLAELSVYIQENSKCGEILLVGTDSNCSERSSHRRYQGFLKFCSDHNLVKVSVSEPTFHHHNGTSCSTIDYFLISQEQAPNITNTAIECTLDHPENFSCHDPVSAKLCIPCPAQSA